ncbi:FtsL-like putative cell division protein [Moheibacter stercoris]|uniref:Cell division protein FtsL n=1 Tax=Moheibacter stercoris TaxID=1628251 RepID=A0ABV2LQU6_9FLAO
MAKNKKSNINLMDILKGKFLVEDGSMQNWRFVLYLVFLAFVSISSSHWVNKKVVKIKQLDEEVSNLKAQYTDAHRYLMKMQLEPEIMRQSEALGIKLTDEQPYVIVKKIYDQEP